MNAAYWLKIAVRGIDNTVFTWSRVLLAESSSMWLDFEKKKSLIYTTFILRTHYQHTP